VKRGRWRREGRGWRWVWWKNVKKLVGRVAEKGRKEWKGRRRGGGEVRGGVRRGGVRGSGGENR